MERHAMAMARRGAVSTLALLILAASAGAAWAAADYPARPIRLIVPIAPGGATDTVARIFGKHVGEILGQPIIIDNRPGAGGTIGSADVASAAPDGYTLLMGSAQFLSISPNLYAGLPYDADKAFAPISQISSSQFALVVKSTLPVKTTQELIAYARAQPGKLNYGSGGNGSTAHLSMELFKRAADIDMTHISYKGSGPMVLALAGGQVQAAIIDLPPVLPFIKEGTIRALALSGDGKSRALPELPSIRESGGLDDYHVTSYLGFVAPAGTPPDVVEKLHQAVVKAASRPEVKQAIAGQGMDPFAPTAPAEFDAFLKKDRAKLKKVIADANVKVD